jgi:hypothetical protein
MFANQTPSKNLDFSESKSLSNFIEVDDLYGILQGYETKFGKTVGVKLEEIRQIIEEFDLPGIVDQSLRRLIYDEMYKKIPFVKDRRGRTAEFYVYKFDELSKCKKF